LGCPAIGFVQTNHLGHATEAEGRRNPEVGCVALGGIHHRQFVLWRSAGMNAGNQTPTTRERHGEAKAIFPARREKHSGRSRFHSAEQLRREIPSKPGI
jgi:hypothetical protein